MSMVTVITAYKRRSLHIVSTDVFLTAYEALKKQYFQEAQAHNKEYVLIPADDIIKIASTTKDGVNSLVK